jgi:TolA-binding protein
LGELRLNQFYQEQAALPSDATKEAGTAVTNILEQARVQFDELINRYPQSRLLGKAYLNRGWCLWEEGDFASSQEAFSQAVQQISVPRLQAVARFKLADAQYQTGDYDAAAQNYRDILEQSGPESSHPEPMREQALYQIVRSGLERGRLAEATQAMQQILEQYPESYFCQRSLILVGQSLNQSGNPALARRVYNSFLNKAPDSSLSPEVQLAVARTYVEEKQWDQAIPRYDQWLREHAQEAARPQVEFDRAWLNYRAGNEKDALEQFSGFVERFSQHPKAPMAQNWIADFHFRQGDYVKAEINYKLLFQKKEWPVSKLTYQAYLMAGRSALARRDFDAAQEYFTKLISRLNNDPGVAPGLLPEALFAYGESWIEKPTPKDDLQKFGEAIKAFGRIANNYPEHDYAPLALGKIGNCHLQLAALDPERYAMATNAYHRAMQMPQADPGTRNLAEVGLANALVLQSQTQSGEEREALLDEALEHFLNVVYQTDPPDLYPVKEAGLAAAKLLETQEKWDKAINLYQQLWELLPPLRETLQKRIDQVKNQRNDPAKLTQNLVRSGATR